MEDWFAATASGFGGDTVVGHPLLRIANGCHCSNPVFPKPTRFLTTRSLRNGDRPFARMSHSGTKNMVNRSAEELVIGCGDITTSCPTDRWRIFTRRVIFGMENDDGVKCLHASGKP